MTHITKPLSRLEDILIILKKSKRYPATSNPMSTETAPMPSSARTSNPFEPLKPTGEDVAEEIEILSIPDHMKYGSPEPPATDLVDVKHVMAADDSLANILEIFSLFLVGQNQVYHHSSIHFAYMSCAGNGYNLLGSQSLLGSSQDWHNPYCRGVVDFQCRFQGSRENPE